MENPVKRIYFYGFMLSTTEQFVDMTIDSSDDLKQIQNSHDTVFNSKPTHQWEFMRSNGGFQLLATSQTVEEAHLSGESFVEYKSNGQLYKINFKNKIQTNMARGCQRCVRRVSLSGSSLKVTSTIENH